MACMCDDCRGRRLVSVLDARTVNTSGVRLLLADQTRIRIVFFPANARDIWLARTQGEAVALDPALLIQAGQSPFELSYALHGDIVRSEIWAIAPAGNDDMSVLEVRLTPNKDIACDAS